MSKREIVAHTFATTDDRPYTPPQPTGGRCSHCGACVLVKEWRDGAYILLPRPLTLALGRIHECDTSD